MRTVILGNSGSGKTWLSRRLSDRKGIPAISLDDIFWLPGGFNRRRDPAEVLSLIEIASSANKWIVEGVFGHLASHFIASATTLIWLDLPWSICQQRLELRGSESESHMSREQTDAGLRELIQWAENYTIRQSSCSHAAHLSLFESFGGERHRLCSESQVLEFLGAA